MTTIRIIQLYPRDMNLYGDWGNVLTLKKRLEWRGFETEIVDHNPGDDTDFSIGDIFMGGGGQDAGQSAIQTDLQARAAELKQLTEQGTPMLLVCGMYQLFGRRFITNTGEEIRGIDVLPLETRAGTERMIGNITLSSDEFGEIVGYENHSGQTFLDETIAPLGQVIRGGGNNVRDQHEGARYKNIIATYLHGPILPRNPQLADFLIASALAKHGDTAPLSPLEIDDRARQAHLTATKRPR